MPERVSQKARVWFHRRMCLNPRALRLCEVTFAGNWPTNVRPVLNKARGEIC